VCMLLILSESGRKLLRRAVLWFCCRIPTHPVEGNFWGRDNAKPGKEDAPQNARECEYRKVYQYDDLAA
jgi:hypothetical protein